MDGHTHTITIATLFNLPRKPS